LAEYITGIPLERMDELIEKVSVDRQEIIETYRLPDSTLLFKNPETYRQELFRVADENGIKIMTHNDLSEEDKIKYANFIKTGSAWYDEGLKAVVCSSTETVNQFKLRELTHELIHGIDLKDKKLGEDISVEEAEYRAYIVADISKEKLEKRDDITKSGVESLFSDGKIAGSCFSYYIEKSKKDSHEFFGGLKPGDGTIVWY
jgi:glucuronate isomerase